MSSPDSIKIDSNILRSLVALSDVNVGIGPLVSRFRFASICGDLVCELRNRKDTSKLLFWCGFGSEVRMTNSQH
jgi:hypothetical protein